MIDTRTGMVDARLATQLAEVAAALLRHRARAGRRRGPGPAGLAAVRALGQGGHVLASAPTAAPVWQKPVAPQPAAPGGPGRPAVDGRAGPAARGAPARRGGRVAGGAPARGAGPWCWRPTCRPG